MWQRRVNLSKNITAYALDSSLEGSIIYLTDDEVARLIKFATEPKSEPDSILNRGKQEEEIEIYIEKAEKQLAERTIVDALNNIAAAISLLAKP